MKQLVQTFLDMADADYLKEHTQALYRLELPQTSPANAAAADYVVGLLKAEGFEAEKLVFPGDGKTVHQDKIMPLCWDASVGRLTVLTPWVGDPVIADYQKEPFSLIRYSASTPDGGMEARVVPWERMMMGEDVRDALVLLPDNLFPTDAALVPVLQHGGLGLINGTMVGDKVDPNATHWANNCTQTNSWFVNADEEPFFGFCITPNIRKQLTKACEMGEVRVKLESDSRRYVGDFNCVTGLLPGESKKELWLMAHLAEPLENDNSSGVIGAVSILRNLRRAVKEGSIPRLKYSVRVLFGAELYGFAAMADYFGGSLRERCVGAISMDGMSIAADQPILRLNFAPPAVPFYGNAIFEGAAHAFNESTFLPPFVLGWGDHYGDDAFLSDASTGLPTLMPTSVRRDFWHSSHQRPGYLDYDLFARLMALYSAFAAGVAAPDTEKLERFIPRALAFAEERLAELANAQPPRAGTCARERICYLTQKEEERLMDFMAAGVDEKLLKNACVQLRTFADRLAPVKASEKTEETPAFDGAKGLVFARKSLGLPHDLANVPLKDRWNPTIGNLIYTPLARIVSNMDGKKDLQQLIMETEWEERKPIAEGSINEYIRALLFLEKYGYLIRTE